MSYDPSKREINLAQHGIDLADCDGIFDNPMLTKQDTRADYGEDRLISLGWLHGKIVVLVWTDREDGPRFISCREATSHERKAYAKAYPAH